jgi:hypothetical protein
MLGVAPMPKLEEAREHMKELSGQLSERTRTVSGGIIAIWWAVLVGETNDTSSYLSKALLVPVLLSGLSILLDFCQYFVGYQMTRDESRAAELAEARSFKYDRNSFRYRLRDNLFYVKQVVMAVALVWLLGALVRLVDLRAIFHG